MSKNCAILHNIVLPHCIELLYFVAYCITLYNIILYCIILCYIIAYFAIINKYIILYYIIVLLKGSPLERGQNLQVSLGKTRNVTHLLAWIDDITCCCEGPRDPLRGVAGLQSKIACKIYEK